MAARRAKKILKDLLFEAEQDEILKYDQIYFFPVDERIKQI